MVMRKSLILVLVVALAALVFAPAAFAQDDNPTGDDLRGGDRGGQRGFDDNPSGDDLMESPAASASASAAATASATPAAAASGDDNPSADDLGGDDRGGQRAFEDNPTGDDAMASPAASASASAAGGDDATATATAGAGGDDDAAASVGGSLPDTGGMSLLSGAAGVLLVGSGITVAMLMRRTS